MFEIMPSKRGVLVFFCILTVSIATTGYTSDIQNDYSKVQQNIIEKYQTIESEILRMSEIMSVTDPKRSELLTRVLLFSREKMLREQFDTSVTLLSENSYSSALSQLKALNLTMRELLTLLENENRTEKVRSEQEELRKKLNEIKDRILEQQAILSQTEHGFSAEKVAQHQSENARATGVLAAAIQESQESAKSSPSSQPSQSDKPENSAEGENSTEQSEQSEQSTDENPTSQALRRAQSRMERAEEKLREAEKSGAMEEQRKALEELESAKAALEKILRQMREEEAKRYLAMLETRLKKIQEIQRQIYDNTKTLDEVPEDKRSENHFVEATRLSHRQADALLEVQKTILLLHEDGSALMFPEVLEQVAQDMQRVRDWLAEGAVDVLVQGLQEDILAALEEMIGAVQQSEKKLDEEKNSEDGQNGESDEDNQALIDKISELRLIRSSQLRVNRRTEALMKMMDENTPEKSNNIRAKIEENLQDLTLQQEKIRKIVHEMGMGTRG